MIEKTYQPAETEGRIYASWERSGAFAVGGTPDAAPFTIMMPPPNVTGSLHMGHALTFTLQDILIRFRRMQGRDTLWQPGTDHAGIATQMVVERQLAAERQDRFTLGRDGLVERIWAWKAQSGGAITQQLRRLGASADWSRERFTMDEGLSAAVRRVFVRLHREGLIYRDKRLVNWDPKLQTALSDLEVEMHPVKGSLWHFRYPVEGEPGRFIIVATTRPETMLGDTGIAVHPDDPRYADLVGRHAVLPLVGRRLPIVADEHADPEVGSGAVKLTPAHDFNDFQVGRRHELERINILTADAHLNDAVPEPYRGLDRFDARKRVVEALEAAGLVEKIEPHDHMVPHGDRSGVVLEPWLTDQWWCDARKLAGAAVAAVEDGRTRFVPRLWENTFFEWMRNIEPWCISRQIWWGHQVPAWFGPDGQLFVAETEAEARQAADAHYGCHETLTRDPDVLDTWFSSALFPFSTLGWPDGGAASIQMLGRHYPTDVLVTGFDIIFFWVARMMMMGLHFMGDVPFRTVYIHALVRDAKGQKMSKSKGNVIDPLALIDAYGCDALRCTLAALAAQGRDIKLATAQIEGYRNFVTKLWNAARFAEMNEAVTVPNGFDPAGLVLPVNRWIISSLVDAAASASTAFEGFRFNEAALGLYQFVWGRLCDWYIEIVKPYLAADEGAERAETRATLAFVLRQILVLFHPIMPFVTEALWPTFGTGGLLMTRPWFTGEAAWHDRDAREELDWVVQVVSEIRTVRSEVGVPPGARITLLLKDAGPQTLTRLSSHRGTLMQLGRLHTVECLEGGVPSGSVQIVVGEATLVLPLGDVVDLGAERARLLREIEKLDAEDAKIGAKLANENFVAKAKPEVVEEQRERQRELGQTRLRLETALARLTAP